MHGAPVGRTRWWRVFQCVPAGSRRDDTPSPYRLVAAMALRWGPGLLIFIFPLVCFESRPANNGGTAQLPSVPGPPGV
jgi:hypothetical protein